MSKKTGIKNLKKCPLFFVTVVSVAIVMIGGLFVVLYGNYRFLLEWDHPVFAAVLAQETEEESTEDILTPEEELATMAISIMQEPSEEETEEESVIETEEESVTEEPTYVDNYEYLDDGTLMITDGGVTEYVPRPSGEVLSPYYFECNVTPVSTMYPYIQVEPDYYENSVFIGDSRIAGLFDYSGWDKATFLYKTGLSIYNVMTADVNLNGTATTTVSQELSARQFENVYIMLGVNELGSGTATDWAGKYSEVVGCIRTLQPDARIIIMSIMYVTTEYETNPKVFNNDNINCRNAQIAHMANGRDIFYLDINPPVVDNTGGLDPEITFDGCHLTAKYYYLLTDYINEHGY